MADKTTIAYNYIKQKIIHGELAPMVSISEDIIADELNMSRMPVHQAVLQLGSEGFLYIFPRKGTVVADISLDTIRWIYEMRFLLEPHLTANACGKIPQAKLLELKLDFEEIKKALSKNPGDKVAIDKAIEYDNLLHSTILNCSDNKLMFNMISNLYDYNEWLRIRISRANSDYLNSVNAHIQIIDALIKGDAISAESAMREHVICSENEAIRFR